MSIIRDLGLTLQSLEDRAAITASTASIPAGTYALLTTQASSGNVAGATSTGSTTISATGRVIDRMSDLFTKALPLAAFPSTLFYSSRGTTSLAPKITVGVSLQHGDSSGGGDMVAYSTGSQQDDEIYFTSARTTDYVNWTTAAVRLQSAQSYYDLRVAKRFIRAVHYVDKTEITTESTGFEGARLSGVVTFVGGDVPQRDLKGIGSTSTST